MQLRPLDRIRSIKLKLVVVIVTAVAISAIVSSVGWRTGIAVWMRPIIAVGLSLLLVYPFSRGITSPLRQMAAAAAAMARGDFTRPVTATSRDEVGDLARSFEQMRSQLAEVDRQRRELIANVSHELRTPLAVLRVRFENIVDGVEPGDPAAMAASLAEIERLSTLVERVLDLSRLESGTSPLHVAPLDVAELIEAATASLRHDEPGAVALEVPSGLVIDADRTRLEQVVRNLVDNAWRHGGGPRRVQARRTAGADGTPMVEISVTDEGPGIPAAERERVLERFHRLDGARASSSGGTGLGLAIATEIVELHHGTIAITDHRPRGCRVSVRLPVTQEPPP